MNNRSTDSYASQPLSRVNELEIIDKGIYARRRIGALVIGGLAIFGLYKIAETPIDKAMGTYSCPIDHPSPYVVQEGQDSWGIAQQVAKNIGAEDTRFVLNAIEALSENDTHVIYPGQTLQTPSHC